ncbi:MAG: type II toxin-antitoxin system VapC family toxin [Candidatus Kapaibacterium sp.]
MGIKYLWDTNTAIYYMQQHFPPSAEKFIDESLINFGPAISVITELELLCWKTPTDRDLEVLRNFINNALVFELEKDIKIKTAEIRKVHKVKLPDAIIAATALVHDLILLTRNVSDFKNIDGLKLINPHEQ